MTPVVRYFPDDPRPAEWRSPIVAVGNFDGVHRGHAKILERICRQAAERQVSPLALTFDPHPPRVVRPDKAPPLLMTPAQKYEALTRVGVHGVGVVRFSQDLSQWDPEHFVRAVLVEWLRAAEVWVGGNFVFGRERSGNFTLLRALGAQYGFRAEKIDPIRYRDFVVSSTRARRLVTEGRVDEVSALLGHHYAIDGHIVRGDGRGRQLGFPTANLATTNELLPPNGVYVTMLRIDGAARPAITNIGVRPTFGGGHTPIIETHVFDLSRDLYDVPVRLWFVQRLRDERPFDGVDALRQQIEADCADARAIFQRISL